MTQAPFFHGTFTLERLWKAAPARVFSAWADPEIKAQWFSGPPDTWTLIRRSMDFRQGGSEVLEGRFAETGMTTLFEGRYHMIEPDRRLVYSYDLFLSGAFHSVTLASLSIDPDGDKSRVRYTEQIIFLDGKDGTQSRIEGTGSHLDKLEQFLERQPR